MEEAGDLIPELESVLLELEEDMQDQELINRVFRALHTIKGSGGMCGFEAVSTFTHHVESVFELARNQELPVSKKLLDLTLSAKDQLQKMIFSPEETDPGEAQAIVQELEALIPDQCTAGDPGLDTPTSTQQQEEGVSQKIYRIRFKPQLNILSTGTDPQNLINELRLLGQAHVLAQTRDIPDFESLQPESCHLWWDVILISSVAEEEIRDVFIFVEDESEINIQLIDDGLECADEELDYKRLGEILLERGDLEAEELQKILHSQKPLGRILSEQGLVQEDQVRSALLEQNAVRQQRKKNSKQESGSSIRVSSKKLDKLVDLVGELVIAQARLNQKVGQLQDLEMLGITEEIERLSDELRDNTLGIRMLPIGSSFNRFRRLVRDLSAEMGKEIKLRTEGADTELDKTVIEQLTDPLVHIFRNSIDHGIEAPHEREAAGKPRQGTIHFQAMHSGGNVLISIQDDGKGLDPQAVREKALQRGLIKPQTELSEKELINLVFAPGFSTAKEVTDVSGRGVGMDVVWQNIESLRGSVDIKSQKGRGTTVTLKLPLTLAIIDGLEVRVKDDFFIIPIHAIEECVELRPTANKDKNQHSFIKFHGQIVPYIRLREWFGISNNHPVPEELVVVGSNGQRMGLAVDELVGQYQTVIKSLNRVYKDVQGVSGATIRGDGSLALILDPEQLCFSLEQTPFARQGEKQCKS